MGLHPRRTSCRGNLHLDLSPLAIAIDVLRTVAQHILGTHLPADGSGKFWDFVEAVRRDRVTAPAPAPLDRRRAPDLTPRQQEVLRLLGRGLTTAQMAQEMGVSIETVRNHVRALLSQLGAQSRLEAVLRAHSAGLLTEPMAPTG